MGGRHMALRPLLAAPINTGDTWMEEVVAGLEVTLIGMLVVFSVLILLFVLLTLIGRLLGDTAPGPSQLPAAGEPDLQPETQALAAQASGDHAVSAVPEVHEPGELVAAIAAAIALATEPGEAPGRRARRQTTKAPRSSWAVAGRIDQAVARATWREGKGS